MKSSSFVMGALTAAVVLAGCAKPPTTEMADAENAVNAAAQAGAVDYASVEFGAAQTALADAKGKMEAKEYKAALAAALETRAKADAALAAVESGKEMAKMAAADAIKSVEAKLKDLKAKAAKVKGAAAAELKSAIKAIETEWISVLEENTKGNFVKVNASANDINNRIDSLSNK